MKKIHIIVIKKKSLLLAAAGLVLCIGLIILATCLLSSENTETFDPAAAEYTILAMNDSGMHCYQEDYSSFMILPPSNTLKVQIFRKGKKSAELISSGITVTYELINNTTSADKTNFWDYAKSYGYDVPPNIGITGNGLTGECKLSQDGKYYEATAIPLTPYNDGSTTRNPFQMVRIRVTDTQNNTVLAQTESVVLPVSDEMECSACHGNDQNILKAHDKLSGTTLVSQLKDGKRYKCADCHKENNLGTAGQQGVLPLSQAMHGFHANKMSASDITPVCYSCHPGPTTQCYRGAMYAAGISCEDPRCHGDMANIAKTQAAGREAWLTEVDCANCHGKKYAVNTDLLYRNSYLKNGPASGMNNLILCESCHNGPHAEWKSTQNADNLLPISLLGQPSYIDKCTVCHQGSGKIHRGAG